MAVLPSNIWHAIEAANAPRSDSYLTAALNSECQKVANAPKGSRNSKLNEAAYYLGKYVAGGELERNEAIERLLLLLRFLDLLQIKGRMPPGQPSKAAYQVARNIQKLGRNRIPMSQGKRRSTIRQGIASSFLQRHWLESRFRPVLGWSRI